MKKILLLIVAVFSAAVFFCVGASAETVITTEPSTFSYILAKAYNGSNYTTEVTKSIRTSVSDKYSVVMFNPQYSMGSGRVVFRSQNPYCVVPASGKVVLTWECMIATSYSTDNYNTDVYCNIGGSGLSSFNIRPVSIRKGDLAVYYSFSYVIDSLNTLDAFEIGNELSDMGLYCSTTNNCTTFEFAISAVTASYRDDSDTILDEDFGYTKPTTPNMDGGLDAGGNLLDQMVTTIDDFNSSITANTQVLIDNVNRLKAVINGVFDCIPLPVTITISGVVVFLVIRKVVGR